MGKTKIVFGATFLLYCSFVWGGDWIELNYPGWGTTDTKIYGISGNILVGWFRDINFDCPFVYDGSNWSPLSSSAGQRSNYKAYGVEGNLIVVDGGWSSSLYELPDTSIASKVLAHPQGNKGTTAHGIDGNNIVGWYSPGYGINNGFVYDGQNWKTVNYPGADHTYIYAISGEKMVGLCSGSVGGSFYYDGTDWKILQADYLTTWAEATFVQGIDGDNIVGYYRQVVTGINYGFLYDGVNWTTLAYPGAANTYVYDIDGKNLVGSYEDENGIMHGFVYTIPEPASLFLFGVGGFWIRRLHVKEKRVVR